MRVPSELATAYVHAGVVQISVANLIVIAAMLVVFVLALVVPLPHRHDGAEDDHE